MQIIIIIVVALSVYALVREYQINRTDKDGYKYTDEEKKFWRKDYIAVIKFLILLIIVVSLGLYFFPNGTDYSEWSDNNYRRP